MGANKLEGCLVSNVSGKGQVIRYCNLLPVFVWSSLQAWACWLPTETKNPPLSSSFLLFPGNGKGAQMYFWCLASKTMNHPSLRNGPWRLKSYPTKKVVSQRRHKEVLEFRSSIGPLHTGKTEKVSMYIQFLTITTTLILLDSFLWSVRKATSDPDVAATNRARRLSCHQSSA